MLDFSWLMCATHLHESTSMTTPLLTAKPWRAILLFGAPILIGNIFQQMYHFVDAIIVGRILGVQALAAVGATGSLIFLLIGFAWGASSGFAIPTAQAFGAADVAKVRRSIATGTVLTAAISLTLSVLGPLIAGPTLALLRTPPELMAEATVFTQVTFLGSGMIMASSYLAAVIRAIGDSRTPLVFLAIACVLNIILVILMVGPLALGVAGAALATVAAQAFSVILCLAFVWRKLPILHVHRRDFRLTRADVFEHLRLGLPMGFQASIIAIGTITVQVSLNTLGTDAVAAFTAASRIDGIAMSFLSSLGIAVSVYVSQNIGANRPDRVRQGMMQAIWMVVGLSIVLGTLMVTTGTAAVRLFLGNGSDEIVHLAWLTLVISGAGYVALGLLFVLRSALQGLGHALVPTLSGIIEVVARVLAAIVLGALFGYIGVALSNPLAWIGAIVLLVPAYVRVHRQLSRGAATAPQATPGEPKLVPTEPLQLAN